MISSCTTEDAHVQYFKVECKVHVECILSIQTSMQSRCLVPPCIQGTCPKVLPRIVEVALISNRNELQNMSRWT